jgi:hypothetical protein
MSKSDAQIHTRKGDVWGTHTLARAVFCKSRGEAHRQECLCHSRNPGAKAHFKIELSSAGLKSSSPLLKQGAPTEEPTRTKEVPPALRTGAHFR